MEKNNLDRIILSVLIIGIGVLVIRAFTTQLSTQYYVLGFIIGMCILYLLIDGLVRRRIMFSFNRYIELKEKPKDFLIVVIFYVIVVIRILYNSLKLIFFNH